MHDIQVNKGIIYSSFHTCLKFCYNVDGFDNNDLHVLHRIITIL